MLLITKDQALLESKFTPDYTPYQIFKLGAFGGTYFREIHSKITDSLHTHDHLQYSWASRIPLTHLTSSIYNPSINYYKVSCGTSLEFWESKGWIKAQDPRGWVQWYCRYHQGRRTCDDFRQIKRWLNVKHRFGERINPSNKIKQVLLHWAIKKD